MCAKKSSGLAAARRPLGVPGRVAGDVAQRRPALVSDKARAGLGTASDRVAQFAERGKAMYETAAEKAREAAKAVREGRDPSAAIADAADETFS